MLHLVIALQEYDPASLTFRESENLYCYVKSYYFKCWQLIQNFKNFHAGQTWARFDQLVTLGKGYEIINVKDPAQSIYSQLSLHQYYYGL